MAAILLAIFSLIAIGVFALLNELGVTNAPLQRTILLAPIVLLILGGVALTVRRR
jgi:hypothetical protein